MLEFGEKCERNWQNRVKNVLVEWVIFLPYYKYGGKLESDTIEPIPLDFENLWGNLVGKTYWALFF